MSPLSAVEQVPNRSRVSRRLLTRAEQCRWETQNWRPRLALGWGRPSCAFFLRGIVLGWREVTGVWSLRLNTTASQQDASEGENLVGCSLDWSPGSLGPSAGPLTNQV